MTRSAAFALALLLVALPLDAAVARSVAVPSEEMPGTVGGPAPPGTPVTGRVVNSDRQNHKLVLTCGTQRWDATVAGGETVLLGAPVAVGCRLLVDDARDGYEVTAAALDLAISHGVVQEVLRALTWTPVLATFGYPGPWPADAVRQWAQSADASSEYSPDGWSAKQATGAPDTPGCGDIRTAWTTRAARSDKPEWLELRYEAKVRAVGARIHVTNAPGALREVQAHTGSGWEAVWHGADPTEACPAVLGVFFQEEVDTDGLRLILDTSGQTTWFEVDAVELIGKPL